MQHTYDFLALFSPCIAEGGVLVRPTQRVMGGRLHTAFSSSWQAVLGLTPGADATPGCDGCGNGGLSAVRGQGEGLLGMYCEPCPRR